MKVKRTTIEYINVPDIFDTGESLRTLGKRINKGAGYLCRIKTGVTVLPERSYYALNKLIHNS